MSDLSIVVCSLVASLLSSVVIYYVGSDEAERQWHERKLLERRGTGNESQRLNATGGRIGLLCNSEK